MPNNPVGGKRGDPYYQAQDILSRRDHSEAEVRDKLRRKKFTDSQIDPVITQLKEKRLLDDQRFATTYIENTVLFKPVGPRWLKMKLRSKRVADGLIEAALSEAFTGDRETQLLQQAAATWRRSHRPPASDSSHNSRLHQQRLYRFLISRGFSSGKISDLLSRSNNEDLV